ncbi:sulfonate transport system ATP-binding protein [Mycoplana sp. BE70]|uniref:ABC transporter ATP-binding protein n=1 Tax=Mycoplana sp. BE70 TaxID=2817775 RepID=UPI002859431D|nr:ABC transporter ATP-binding protein [Mycoplana sp. BE70]MDR6755589.1 sulfonate transport system ATP-binding protein [Mycoplana sp. BE70]
MLELRNISRSYRVGEREVVALCDISVTLQAGSFTTVVGRSGCGKTTLLRILAGLTEPSDGTLEHHAEGGFKVGVVFQDARLMPWLNVFDNVAFGLRGRLDRHEIENRCLAVLELVGLANFRAALPAQLSGGMAQRVAIARALVMEPDLLLLDEPFAALDAFTRRTMQAELINIWQERRPTVVFVTHDVEEAVLLGQSVLELDQGHLVGRDLIDAAYPRDPTDPAISLCRRRILERLLAPKATASNTHKTGDIHEVPHRPGARPFAGDLGICR